MPVPLAVVDAFSDRPFAGNPAGVCLLDGPAPEPWMAAVAAEVNVSETAFVHPVDGSWGLRWFTPTVEVPLCGHATLASAHLLAAAGRIGPDEAVTFVTASGPLTAEPSGEGWSLDLPAYEREGVAPSVGEAAAAAVVAPVVDVARYGPKLLVAVGDVAAVTAGITSLEAVAALPGMGLLLTAPAPGGYVLRYFAPSAGIDEDPVTGSAQCAAAPYWHDATGTTHFEVRQLSARGGTLTATLGGGRVAVTGRAVTVWRAEMFVEPSVDV